MADATGRQRREQVGADGQGEAARPGGDTVRRVRLWAGLIVFVFLATHLLNHALGLISIGAMDAGRRWFLVFWSSWPGTVLLYGSLAVHLTLALVSIYRRPHLRMPVWEAVQIILGLAIPLILIAHVIGTRFAYEWFGAEDSYARMILLYWIWVPYIGAKQALLLAIGWGHGCIGLHYWLRLKPWYPRWFPALLAAAVLVAVLALLGFSQAGRENTRLNQQPGWSVQLVEATRAPSRAENAFIIRAIDEVWYGYVLLLALVLAARGGAVRLRKARREGARHLSGRAGDSRPGGGECPRGEPPGGGSPRLGVRGAGALLDLPGPGAQGD